MLFFYKLSLSECVCVYIYMYIFLYFIFLEINILSLYVLFLVSTTFGKRFYNKIESLDYALHSTWKTNNITICPCSDKAPVYPSLLCPVLKRCEFCVSVTQACLTLLPHGLQPTRLLCPWHFQGKNTWVSCHFLLQGIFQTQGLNPGLWHCRQIPYCLSQQGSPLLCVNSTYKEHLNGFSLYIMNGL